MARDTTVIRRIVASAGIVLAMLTAYPSFAGAVATADVLAGDGTVLQQFAEGPRDLATTVVSDFVSALPVLLVFSGVVVAAAALASTKLRLPTVAGAALIAAMGAAAAGAFLSGGLTTAVTGLLFVAGALHGALLGAATSLLIARPVPAQ